MGKITKIECQKHKERVNLYIDDSFFCGLMTETLILNGLKVGQSVDENTLKNVIFESEVRRGSDYAFGLVARRQYSSSEIAKKLKIKGFADDVCLAVVNKLIEYKYIDDERYASAVVASSGLKSRRQIEQKLKQKGISNSTIEKTVSVIKSADESSTIAKIIEKYSKNKEINSEFLQKLFRYLCQKGFDFDLIKSEISKFKQKGDFDDESWD